MPNVRIVFDNRYDAATVKSADALPSLPIENTQQAGRMRISKLKQIDGVTAVTSGWQTLMDMAWRTLPQVTISAWLYSTCSVELRYSWSGNYSYVKLGNAYAEHHRQSGLVTTTASGTVTNGVWRHAALVFDAEAGANNLKLYYNGTNTASATTGNYPLGYAANVDSVLIARLTAAAGNRLARVRMDARAMSGDEITRLMNHRYVDEGSMIDRWALVDGSLTTERGITGPVNSETVGPDAHGTTNVVQISGNWSANETLNVFALVRTNLTSATTMRLRIYNAINGGGTVLYDSGTMSAQISGPRTGDYTNVAFYFQEVTTARSFVLEINNGTTPVDIARIVAGKYFEPSTNVEVGMTVAWRDTGSLSRLFGGGIIAEVGEVYRQLTMSFGRLTDDERNTMSALLYTARGTREVFVSVFPQDAGPATNSQREIDHSLTGTVTAQPLTYGSVGNWTLATSIEET